MMSISNWVFTAYIVCKNPAQTRKKNQVAILYHFRSLPSNLFRNRRMSLLDLAIKSQKWPK